MRTSVNSLAWVLLLAAPVAGYAQAGPTPAGDPNPVLRVEAGGPTSLVEMLAFGPDGRTLYAGGWDKVVRVWRLDAEDRWWREAPAYRVPLGPGSDGKINAIAVSADGNWLAAAGSGAVRSRAGFRQTGIVVPSLAMSPAMREDQGVIYVFDVNTREARVLRGHAGPVLALAFAPARPGAAKEEPPPLVSAALERPDGAGPFVGAVRLWDVAKKTSQAWPGTLPRLKPGDIHRPGVAAWRTSAQPESLHVAVAWGDGKFRVWDIARGKDGVSERADARYNVTVASFPDRQRLVTGGLRSPSGYLQVWRAPAGEDVQPERQIPDREALAAGVAYVPLAITPLSSKPGGAADQLAAALVVQQGQVRQIRLHLVDFHPARFGSVRANIPLWKYQASMPAVAAAPGGRFLAIADTEDQEGHGIYVYVVADLLTKKDQAVPWRLSGIGEPFRYVSFVRSPKGLGLLLNTTAKGEPGAPPRKAGIKGDVVFDFAKPGFAGAAGWTADVPSLAGWTVTRGATKAGERERAWFRVGNGTRARTITLEAGQTITEFALLPPPQLGAVPLLAVAVKQVGEPALLLYDAASGKLLRHFTGHDDFIRCLAFSGDGKLLVSAADDQTVCVWSLTNLDQLRGKHGLLAGLAVKDRDKEGVLVGRVDEDSPAAGKLAKGDVIDGLVVDGKVKQMASAADFYNAIWQITPGETVTLQVAGKGRVTLPVDQGVDETHPLLTLFTARATRAGERDWIGWNPQGPYATSGARAEQYLGWHINTGKPEAPTSFAKAAEYRGKYYKEGLLKHLVARAALAPALQDLKKEEEAKLPPDPRVLVQLGDEVLDPTRADSDGLIPVRPRQLTLRVQVDELPADKIGAVEWEIDGKGLHRFEPSAGAEWSADLPRWDSGKHTVRVVVRTPGGRRPDYTVGPLPVCYQPPPPRLTTDLPLRQVTKAPEFLLRATAAPEVPGQDIAVSVKLNGKAVPVPSGPEIRKQVSLQRGDNFVEIVAVNKNALAGHERAETARLALEVVYDPQAPQIVLEEVIALPAGTEGVPQAVKPGEPVVVSVPRLRVRGKITALAALTTATVGDSKLAGFQAGQKELTVNQEVSLHEAGPQKLAFTARTKDAAATRSLDVEYRPQLPSLVFLPPKEGLVFVDEGKGPPEVTLRFQVKPPRDPAPFAQELQTTVLVNGERQPNPPPLAAAAKELPVKLTPKVRDSQVQVRLSAPWAEPQTSEAVAVQYLRVPYRIEFVNPPGDSQTPEVNLTARVQSALPLEPRDVRATVLDQPISTVEVEKQGGQTWLVRLKNVSLNGMKGSKSTVRLEVANQDGPARVPAACDVIYRGPPPKRADVAIVSPRDVNVTEPAVTVQFRVSSESKLRRLAVVNQDAKTTKMLDVPDTEGPLEGKADIALVPGPNRLQVTAVNEAGEQQSLPVVVSYLPPPVRVVLDRLEPLDGGPAVPVQVLSDGRVTTRAPQGRLLLHGRVVWSKERDERLKGLERVVVRVNGVQQVEPAKLAMPAPDKPRERAFQVKVFLSKPPDQDNQLEVTLPGLAQEDSDRQVYRLACDRPVPEKRVLHLLIVGIGEKEGGRLRDRVLKALGTTSVRGREFTVPTFDQGLLYGPLLDTVRPVEWADVFRQFLTVKKNMDALARNDLYTHVVMVYYQGNEVVKDDGFFLRTSGPELDPSLQFYRIPCTSLQKLLTGNARGVQILLMDVAREPAASNASAGAQADGDVGMYAHSAVAVMRTAFLGTGRPLEKAALINALEASLRQAIHLREVEQGVARQVATASQRSPNPLFYASHIAPGLADLPIGMGQKR
jgi:WD40 repeat protein